MTRFAILVNGFSVGRYEATDACDALANYLADRRRAEVRRLLKPGADGETCAIVEIDGETLEAHRLPEELQ